MFQVKIFIAVLLMAGAGGAYLYVKGLKADLAVSEANNLVLEQSITQQKAVIAQQKQDFDKIIKANEETQVLNQKLNNDLKTLDNKFNKTNASGKKRDMGDLAIARSSTVEKIINKASGNATRCVEIATGAPLTEKEENATKKSQINPECTSIANPNYVPY
jgi:hypothetical protein